MFLPPGFVYQYNSYRIQQKHEIAALAGYIHMEFVVYSTNPLHRFTLPSCFFAAVPCCRAIKLSLSLDKHNNNNNKNASHCASLQVYTSYE